MLQCNTHKMKIHRTCVIPKKASFCLVIWMLFCVNNPGETETRSARYETRLMYCYYALTWSRFQCVRSLINLWLGQQSVAAILFSGHSYMFILPDGHSLTLYTTYCLTTGCSARMQRVCFLVILRETLLKFRCLAVHTRLQNSRNQRDVGMTSWM